jgi:hypothetical protein
LWIFELEQLARKRAFSKSEISNRQSQFQMSAFSKALARQPEGFCGWTRCRFQIPMLESQHFASAPETSRDMARPD